MKDGEEEVEDDEDADLYYGSTTQGYSMALYDGQVRDFPRLMPFALRFVIFVLA
jgi:hypothetical protein